MLGVVWGAPAWLALLALLPIYGWWYARRYAPRRLRLSLSYDPAAEAPHAERWAWLRHVPPVLTLLALTALVLALARPQRVTETVVQTAEGIELMLVLDISESMDADDLAPTRLEAAKATARLFVQARPNDRIGLMLVAQDALLVAPPTRDQQFLLAQLDEVRPTIMPRAGTALGNALGLAYTRLKPLKGSRAVILITDGVNNRGLLDPVSAARLLGEIGVRVYPIGVGRALRGREQGYDAATLNQVAALTQGAFFEATDAEALTKVFDQINQLTRTPLSSVVARQVSDLYPAFLLTALLLLVAAWGLMALGLSNPLED